MAEKGQEEVRQETTGGELTLTPPLRGVRVRTLKDAKRLLSRLITQLQAGTIEGKNAKDLTYVLSVFVQVVKDSDIEERLTKLEEANGRRKQ